MVHKQTNTPKAFANHRWHKMQERVANLKCYAHVKVLITKQEFYAWVNLNWTDIIAMRKNGDEPSIDRIDSAGNYELTNMRIIPLRQNVLAGSVAHNKARTARLRAKHPPKNCLKCGTLFDRNKGQTWKNFSIKKYCGGNCRMAMRKRDSHGRVVG